MISELDAGSEAGSNACDYLPSLTTFARYKRATARTVGALAGLSFWAGYDSDAHEDWRTDMLAAVDLIFPAALPARRRALEAILSDAFYAGADHATIQAASRPAEARQAAQAKAFLHGFANGRDAAAWAAVGARSAAHFIAMNLPIGADQAAACAIDTFHDAGFAVPELDASFVLDGAGDGMRAREDAEEADREILLREETVLGTIVQGPWA